MRKILTSPPSLRLNTTIVLSVVLLLAVSMGVITYQSLKTLQQETEQNAEKTLEALTMQADNVLYNVQQATGNVYSDMIMHFSETSRMETYAREIVKSSPYIYGCAIAISPKALKVSQGDRFLTYTHRKAYDSSELITTDRYSEKNYMEQAWFLSPAEVGQVYWMLPKKDRRNDDVPVMLYCISVRFPNGDPMSVIAVEVSMDLLSQIVQKGKPSPHSYCMLLDADGSYIIHPDRNKLKGETLFTLLKEDSDDEMRKTAEAMLSGDAGKSAFQADGQKYRAFYRPFLQTEMRSSRMYNMKWTIALVMPEDDVTSPLKGLLLSALTISVIGLLLFFILTRIIIRRHTKPLRKLTEVAEEIAGGSYDEEIHASNRMDEIGEFQRSFKHMQEALLVRVNEQERLTDTLQQHLEQLRQTYEQIREDEHVQIDFLHNMTDQILVPARTIYDKVNTLCDDSQNITQEQAQQDIETIRQQRADILGILNHLLSISEDEVGKEDSHE